MKFLIAPWGDPSGWKEVIYIFNRGKIKSKTSLKILQKVIKPDRTIIIGLDTLAESGKNYREVKANAREKIKKYANEFGLRNYEILIAPGIGKFQNGVFQGYALDYYFYIITKISLELLGNFGNYENLSIHLDLTHGINYSTILTYRAIKEIAGIFSIFKEVRFRAYNADPSLPRIADKLSINVIEDTIPIPTPFAEKLDQKRPLEPISLSPKERKELFKDKLKSIREINSSEVSAFIGALYNGLPLALFSFYPKKDRLKEIILAVLNFYEEYVEVKERDKLEVVRKTKFGKGFKVYVFAYVIATLLENLKLISSQKREVTLNEIENLKENLFKFDERFKVRIDKDIYTFKENLEGKEIKDWRMYNEILGRNIGEPDARNFLAHSGFEGNVVEVKKENGKLLLRYRQDKLGTIMDLCKKGLK